MERCDDEIPKKVGPFVEKRTYTMFPGGYAKSPTALTAACASRAERVESGESRRDSAQTKRDAKVAAPNDGDIKTNKSVSEVGVTEENGGVVTD